jgi:predicted dehydrogenase
MAENKVKIGFIGVGNIFKQYMQGVGMYPILEVAMLADLNVELAKQKAAEYNVPKAGTVEELLADPEIELVINLTIPNVHSAVSIAAINSGKHVYCEKPLGVTREEGKAVIDAAKAKGVLVGCAPDTFLGGGLQTCRYLIDSGEIGTPVAATAFMLSHGPESWHPNPFFYYAKGGGPVLDMGPYYLTALVHLLGPAQRMAASTRMSFPERTATSQLHNGKKIPVEVSTHSAGVIDFAAGTIVTMIMSFDIWAHNMPRIEIYGSEGSLSVPDPNTFGGPVLIRKAGESEWREVPLTHESKMLRGVGPADMAYAIRTGRPHRASGELAYHVLDMMVAFDEASEQGKFITLSSTCQQPAALPAGLALGQLDS